MRPNKRKKKQKKNSGNGKIITSNKKHSGKHQHRRPRREKFRAGVKAETIYLDMYKTILASIRKTSKDFQIYSTDQTKNLVLEN